MLPFSRLDPRYSSRKFLRVPVRFIFFSMEQFHTQKKSNVPFRLFADNLRVGSNKGIFEDESLPVYVLEGDFLKDPNIEGEEAQIRKLGCFHSVGWILDVVLASS